MKCVEYLEYLIKFKFKNFDNILRDIEIYVDTSQKEGPIPLDYLLN